MKMSYAEKIQKELDKLDDQWHDARCPDVRKFGENADRKIKKLTAINQELVEALENIITTHSGDPDDSYYMINIAENAIKRAKELTNEG